MKNSNERVYGQSESLHELQKPLSHRMQDFLVSIDLLVLSFEGPSGWEKLKLQAKAVAQIYFENENNVIRLDMGSARKNILSQNLSALLRLCGLR